MRESFTWAGAQSPAIGGGAAKTAKLYPCSICGRGWPKEQMVYSTPTGQHFCPVAEWDKCIRPEDA